MQPGAGLQNLETNKTSYSWFHLTCVVKMNHCWSPVKGDQGGSAEKCVSLSQNVFQVLEKHGDVEDEVVFNVPFLWFSGEYLEFRIRNTYIGSCLLFFFFCQNV